jgi:hypothetical protein
MMTVVLLSQGREVWSVNNNNEQEPYPHEMDAEDVWKLIMSNEDKSVGVDGSEDYIFVPMFGLACC